MIGILTRPDDGRFIDANGISLYLEEHGDGVPVLAAAGFRVITPGHRPGARGRPCLGGSGRLADDDALPGPRPHADRDLGAASTCPGHRTPAGDSLVPAVLPVPRRRRGHHRRRRLALAAHVQPWRRGPRAGDPDLSRPGALTASLNWYRANVAPRMPGPPLPLPPVLAPTLGIWSARDHYVDGGG